MTKSTTSIFLIFGALLVSMTSSTPILVVRRQLDVQPRHTISSAFWRNLQEIIGEEQNARDQFIFVEEQEEVPQRLERLRRNIPNNYHDDFSVDEFVVPIFQDSSSPRRRYRRAQPILDNTDEFSADPFETSQSTVVIVPANYEVVVYPKRDV
ncbi:unnamed protein product [Caenorhabditis angaria]|uniref:Uncharacterized protein n=1 Tax=Caenorhabditis angaria TaxID=860376 RepID=A0A9P1N0H9_9PELO|nr:unnamed protein product [Caenorhabditis angaria]